MWLFSSDEKLDSAAREAWGKRRWVGVAVDIPRPKTASASQKLTKGIVSAAKTVRGPVIVGLSKDHGGGSRGIRIMWPDGVEGVDAIEKARSFPQYKYDVGSTMWNNMTADSFDMALALCKWGADQPNPIPGAGTDGLWRINFTTKP